MHFTATVTHAHSHTSQFNPSNFFPQSILDFVSSCVLAGCAATPAPSPLACPASEAARLAEEVGSAERGLVALIPKEALDGLKEIAKSIVEATQYASTKTSNGCGCPHDKAMGTDSAFLHNSSFLAPLPV